MSPMPPLALDIDGTMTRRDDSIEPRFFDVLADWSSPVILATGKAFPYPVALCHFMRLPTRVVAENGGVVCVDDAVEVAETADRIEAFAERLADDGVDLGWGATDLVNRWRETELAVDRIVPRQRLASIAETFDLDVVDSGYAYHVKDASISKGRGIERAASLLDLDTDDLVAIGDSENDVSTFEVVGEAIALANADDAAKRSADRVVDGAYAAGTLDVLAELASR
ncbi:MAG: HAD-IIB family hydrolase [Halobacteriota archaeon]